MFEYQGKEYSQPETVRGMPRNKTILAAPVAVHYIHKLTEIGVMSRTKTLKQRLEERGRDLVAQHKEKDKEEGYQECFLAWCFVEKQKQDKQKQGYPYKPAADGPHHLIEEQGVTAIQCKKRSRSRGRIRSTASFICFQIISTVS